MLTGKPLGTGVAQPIHPRVAFTMIEPDSTPENITALGREAERWKQTALRYVMLRNAGQLSPDVARRAQFADEVLAVTAENVRRGICCALVAQGEDGRILGVMVYNYGAVPITEAYINLLALDAEHLAGSPGSSQLRGVGTSMVAAASRRFLERGVQSVYIHPLDEAAAQFWTRRGFSACGRGGLMCVRGPDQVRALLGTCQTGACDDEVCVVCGRAEDTEAVRLPALRR